MEVSYKARPFKVASNDRRFKGVVATNLRDLKEIASKSLGLSYTYDEIIVMLAEDDTLIDNEEYFSTLMDNTKLILTADESNQNKDETDFAGSHEQTESQEINSCQFDLPGSLHQKLTTTSVSECIMAFLTMSNDELEYLSSCNNSYVAQAIGKSEDVVAVFVDNANHELVRRRELSEATQLLNMFERAKSSDSVDGTKRKKPLQ